MLVENKFIYISLPRCASTSFMASCVQNGLNINYFNEKYDIENQLETIKLQLSDIKFENFEKYIIHPHEPIDKLELKFGKNVDIIAVKRDKYERFISLWNVVLREINKTQHDDTFNILANLKIDDILFYSKDDLKDENSISNVVNELILRNNLVKITELGKIFIRVLITPYSYYHQHNPNIIWFDFNELHKLEDWVSNKLNIDFKLSKINSNKIYNSNLILNDEFKEKYDSIYSKYDEIKNVKTMI
jgi:hypothetical protein